MKPTRIGGLAMLGIAVFFASACATEARRVEPGPEPGAKAGAALRGERDALAALRSAEKARDMATDAEADRRAKDLFDDALDLLIAGYDSLEGGDDGAAARYFDEAAEAFEVSSRAASRDGAAASRGSL